MPQNFGPVTRKRKKCKPFLVEHRYVGSHRLPITSFWLHSLYPREWTKWDKYYKEAGAEQAISAFKQNKMPWMDAESFEFRIIDTRITLPRDTSQP